MDDLEREILESYGARYFDPDARGLIYSSGDEDLYAYRVYANCEVKVNEGDCLYYLDKERDCFMRRSGEASCPVTFGVLIRGYTPSFAAREAQRMDTNLPYVNGCSTEQIFPPIRAGDPTMQLLYIPPHTAEQAHHIHSTVRAVYVLSGSGESIVGTSEQNARAPLTPGRICLLEKMCPHHFETHENGLVVIPVHVWSSTGGGEYNHPMFNGTYLIDR